MKLVFFRKDIDQYFTGEDGRGLLHWSSSKDLAKSFEMDIKDKNLQTLNRFLSEYFSNFWEYNNVTKEEYIDKIKNRFQTNEVVFILRCHNEKIKIKVEKL